MRRNVAPAVVVAMVSLLVACGGGEKSGTAAPKPTGLEAHDAALLEGRRIFVANCAQCHGSAGQGGTGPALAQGRAVASFPDINEQIAVVANGRPINMPAYGRTLTPEQITDVVRYTREVL